MTSKYFCWGLLGLTWFLLELIGQLGPWGTFFQRDLMHAIEASWWQKSYKNSRWQLSLFCIRLHVVCNGQYQAISFLVNFERYITWDLWIVAFIFFSSTEPFATFFLNLFWPWFKFSSSNWFHLDLLLQFDGTVHEILWVSNSEFFIKLMMNSENHINVLV